MFDTDGNQRVDKAEFLVVSIADNARKNIQLEQSSESSTVVFSEDFDNT